MTEARRRLSFTKLSEVIPDVQQLLTQRHRTVGRWSLGQICAHLVAQEVQKG
jgi:hypothetical protein